MIGRALQRPVAVIMIFTAFVLLGAISFFLLPLDLLPEVRYPALTVTVHLGGYSPGEIEQTLRDSVILGSRARLRPILMTTLATILALVPLALGRGEGAELRVPLALTVIGGLLASTFLTLFIVPLMYLKGEEYLQKWRSFRQT